MTTPTQTEAAVLRDAIAVLREARKLLECGWCQGALARNAQGRATGPQETASTGWSLEGALWEAHHALGSSWSARHIALLRTRTAVGEEFLWEWNDAPGRTQAEVLAAVDRAVELGEQELAKLDGGGR